MSGLSRRIDWLRSFDEPRLDAFRWEVGEEGALREILEGADAVCHLAAAVPRGEETPGQAEECIRVNALGTLHLLKVAAESRIGRFVDFSAGNAYAVSGRPATEEDPLYPSGRASYYLTSKLAEEIFAAHHVALGSFAVTILRLSAVYGPGMRPDSLVAALIDRARRGLPMEVHDGGTYAADLVYVDDVAEAALLAIEKRADGVFNVGSGVATSTLEVARAVAEIFGLGSDAIRVLEGDREVGFAPLDIGKARRILGYIPTVLNDGIRRFIAAPEWGR